MTATAGELAPIETWNPGDEFRWAGDWLEVLHMQPLMGAVLVTVDADKAGDPPRVFHGTLGTVRRVRRVQPTELTFSWKDERK